MNLTDNSIFIPQTNALDFERATIVDVLNYRAKHQSNCLAYRYLAGDEEIAVSYGELAAKANKIANLLKEKNLQRERVLLVYAAGLEFIYAFFGCLKAGAIAVPIYPPRRDRQLARLRNIVNDCRPKAILTTNNLKLKIKDYLVDKKIENYIATDIIKENYDNSKLPKLTEKNIAFLQYTSGSTGNPKGVIITHKNIIYNSQLIYRCFEHSANTKVVSWLPFYHDMGLIGGILQPLYGGFPVTLFSPTDFLRKPLLWLETISKYRATTSGAPNFAYELCIDKIKFEEKQKLDLSSWDLVFIGAEPIRAETLDKFAEAFAECGFKKSAFYPCYGMAEATLMVTGGLKQENPVVEKSQKSALRLRSGRGRGQKILQSSQVVSCGKIDLGQEVIIVNTDTNKVSEDEEIGEIWIAENNSIAAGYWNREKLSRETFQAQMNNSNKHYLRTGDLGFIEDGKLFVTGRIKDIIIIRGQNYYPQDIEKVVERSHYALKANSGAAFSVEIAGKEQLVIVQEVERSYVRKLGINNSLPLPRLSRIEELKQEIKEFIRSTVSQGFGLNVYDIQLIKTGSICKTSSGKIQRYLCKEKYLAEVQGSSPKGLATSSDREGYKRSKEQIARIKSIIDWLRDYAEENINSQLIDERRCIPPYIVLDFGNKGLLGMKVPQEYGGLGLNNYETMQILEQLGAIDTTLCLFVGLNNILGIRPILNYGSEELKQELLPILATGRELAAFALTEKGAGSNPQGIVSQAVASSENSWNIQGEKIWSGSAAWAGVTNVFVQHEDINGNSQGISAFAVRRGTPGLRQGKEALTMGMKGMVQNTVYFDDVPVTSQQLLGKPGKGMDVAQDAMMYGRLAIAASCLGGMKRCAQLMLRYTSRRQVSTGRLLDNPVVLIRLGELTAQITAVECLVTQIAKLLDEGGTIPVELYTACKTSAPEFYWQAADSLVQFLGGRGYIETNIAPQILRDARILRIFEGPTETLNMFLGSRVVNFDPPQPPLKKGESFSEFIGETLNCADVYQQLREAIAKVSKHFQDNPVFSKSLDNKRWIYILVGQVATYAILLAATKYSYQQNPTEELARAVSWAEFQFQQEIEKAIAPHELITQEADFTEDLIESYRKAIGNIQQNLAGEDREIDELLESRGAAFRLRSRRGEVEEKNPLPVTRPSGAEHSLARSAFPCASQTARGLTSVGDAGSPLYPLPKNPVTQTEVQESKQAEEWLSQWLSDKLQISLEKIDRAKAFADYGIDSVMAVELAQDLAEWLPNELEIEPTLAWNFPSIEALAGYIGSQKLEVKSQKSKVKSQKLEENVSISESDVNRLSEDEVARSLLQEIALAKGRDE